MNKRRYPGTYHRKRSLPWNAPLSQMHFAPGVGLKPNYRDWSPPPPSANPCLQIHTSRPPPQLPAVPFPAKPDRAGIRFSTMMFFHNTPITDCSPQHIFALQSNRPGDSIIFSGICPENFNQFCSISQLFLRGDVRCISLLPGQNDSETNQSHLQEQFPALTIVLFPI